MKLSEGTSVRKDVSHWLPLYPHYFSQLYEVVGAYYYINYDVQQTS